MRKIIQLSPMNTITFFCSWQTKISLQKYVMIFLLQNFSLIIYMLLCHRCISLLKLFFLIKL